MTRDQKDEVREAQLDVILSVITQLAQGRKKLVITKTYKHDPSDNNIVNEEKTTYRIVDTL